MRRLDRIENRGDIAASEESQKTPNLTEILQHSEDRDIV